MLTKIRGSSPAVGLLHPWASTQVFLCAVAHINYLITVTLWGTISPGQSGQWKSAGQKMVSRLEFPNQNPVNGSRTWSREAKKSEYSTSARLVERLTFGGALWSWLRHLISRRPVHSSGKRNCICNSIDQPCHTEWHSEIVSESKTAGYILRT